MLKKWRNSLLVLVVLLAAAEGCFYFLNPYPDAEPAGNLYRNPFFKRGWPEYVQGTKPEGKQLAILLSNSQGFGNEMKDPADIYFASFQAQMAESNPDWAWENWSLSGLRTGDLELLTIQAQVREVDRLFIAVNFGNFDFAKNIHPAYANTDVNLLYGQTSFWPQTEQTLLAKEIDRDEIIEKALTLNSNTMRFRTPLFQFLSGYVPEQDEVFWFGNPVNRARHFDLQQTPDFRQRISQGKTRKKLDAAEISARLATFEKFLAHFQRRLGDDYKKVTFLWTPISSEFVSEEELRLINTFNVGATRMLRTGDFKIIDLSKAMEPEWFLSRGHFTQEGHQVFAKKFHSVLRYEL